MEGVNSISPKINAAMARVLSSALKEDDGTQPELAEATGIPARTIQRLLSGESKINVQHLALIAEALRADPKELFARAIRRAEKMPDAPLSEAAGTTDDMAARRRAKQAEAAGMITEDLEKAPSAATLDPELDSDEPDIP